MNISIVMAFLFGILSIPLGWSIWKVVEYLIKALKVHRYPDPRYLGKVQLVELIKSGATKFVLGSARRGDVYIRVITKMGRPLYCIIGLKLVGSRAKSTTPFFSAQIELDTLEKLLLPEQSGKRISAFAFARVAAESGHAFMPQRHKSLKSMLDRVGMKG